MPPRLPPPWTVTMLESAFVVQDANGFPLAYVHFEGRIVVGTNPDRLTRDQARRIAANIAKLPDLLKASVAIKA